MDNENPESLGDAEALDRAGLMIDRAHDTDDSELIHSALCLLDQIATRPSLSGEQRILVHYFRANAFEARLAQAGEALTWAWDIPNFDTVLFELRRAVRDECFSALNPLRQCQILTNLGNK